MHFLVIENETFKNTGGDLTPRKWVAKTPITLLFERATELYNTHYSKILGKSLENLGKFSKIGEKF